MPAKSDGSPVVDLASVAVSPGLIMLMVGSLVWFLVDVLSPSSHPDRLLWCLSFFVFGAVLVARITIELGYGYAAMYAAALGGATFLATIAYVEYPNRTLEAVGWGINFALMALIWWLVDRLTWDCTHLDEDQRTSGRGLLAAAGWDDAAQPDTVDGDADDPERAARRKKKDAPGLMGWLERMWRYKEARKKRPHTPGTWVLYFGLAALPVFALGQSLIPADDHDRRRATLQEAAVFVASGLGLLVTTSLMGLRRYLQQRDARIPQTMAVGWLGLGAGLIAAFVLAAMVLPRPHSETAWIDLGQKKSSGNERSASRNAVVRDDSAGKGEGATGTKGEPGKDGQTAKGGRQQGQGGEKGQGQSQSGSQGKSGSGQSNQGKSGQGGNQSGGKQSGDAKGGSQKGDAGDKSDSGASKGRDRPRGGSGKGEESKGGESGGDAKSESDGGDRSDSNTGSAAKKLGEALGAVSTLMKWLVWIAVALAVLAGVVYFVLKGIAPFTDWARNLLDWFRSLFARGEREVEAGEDGPEAAVGPRRVPFAEFDNPFADGTARRRSSADLAVYTLAALDAWAGDRGSGRRPGETPAEFAVRLGDEYPDLDAPGRRAADLAVRALYSTRSLPADAPKALAGLWTLMERSAVPAAAR